MLPNMLVDYVWSHYDVNVLIQFRNEFLALERLTSINIEVLIGDLEQNRQRGAAHEKFVTFPRYFQTASA